MALLSVCEYSGKSYIVQHPPHEPSHAPLSPSKGLISVTVWPMCAQDGTAFDPGLASSVCFFSPSPPLAARAPPRLHAVERRLGVRETSACTRRELLVFLQQSFHLLK